MTRREPGSAGILSRGWWMLLAAVMAAASVAVADAGATAQWTVDATGVTVIGAASVAVEMHGEIAGSRGLAPCAGGELTGGRVVVGEGEQATSGVLTYGLATAGCVPGYPNGVYAEARGYWETPSTTPFTLKLIGIRHADGSISGIVADVRSSFGGRRRGESGPLPFSGRIRGDASSTGFGAGAGAIATADFVERLRQGLPSIEGVTAGVPGTAAARGKHFTGEISTKLTLGTGDVTVKFGGRVSGGGKDCAAGGINAGKLVISDADDTFSGVVMQGYLTTCGKGGGSSFNGSVTGVMKDSQGTPFVFSFQGTAKPNGTFESVSGTLQVLRGDDPIGKGKSAGNVLEEVALLRSKVVTYFGTTDQGAGHVVDFDPPVRPDPKPRANTFELKVTGNDGADIALTASGNFYAGYPRPSDVYLAGRLKLEVTVGKATYAVQANQIYFQRESASTGRINITGSLREPKEGGSPPEAVGFIIAELMVTNAKATLFTEGGTATVGGSIASLRVGGKTYTPDVNGTFVAHVRGELE